MGAKSDRLWAVCEEVFYADAGGICRWSSLVVNMSRIIALNVVVQGYGNGILRGPVCSVGELVGVKGGRKAVPDGWETSRSKHVMTTDVRLLVCRH